MHTRKLALTWLAPHAIVLVLVAAGAFAAAPLGFTFTYQGRLTQSGNAVNGNADLQFRLWDGSGVGSAAVTPFFSNTTSVVEGVFTVDLNFGPGTFNGDERWLEIAVRFPAGAGSFTTLTPRQRLNAAPYALALPGMFTQPNATSPNIIGGFKGNTILATAVGATISGGGQLNDINSVTADFGTVGGGRQNIAGSFGSSVGGGIENSANGQDSAVGGGFQNLASGNFSAIAGGFQNTTSGDSSFVGGGFDNTAGGSSSTVAGGVQNSANADKSTIGGGEDNLTTGIWSTVGGGSGNTAGAFQTTVGGGNANAASSNLATVAGGSGNTASGAGSTVGGGGGNTASGLYSTVAGGDTNLAQGNYSFAAGRRAKAAAQGTFVWADSTNADFFVGGNNRFSVRASGGAEIFSNAGITTGVFLSAGSGSWASVSDRAVKSNIQPVDPADALNKLLALPISTWNYTAQDESIRHIGPMAQDFHAAFGLGEDDKHITTIDADGVALAAIQGLHHRLNQALIKRDDEIFQLRQMIAAQAAVVAKLEAQLGELRASVEISDDLNVRP